MTQSFQFGLEFLNLTSELEVRVAGRGAQILAQTKP